MNDCCWRELTFKVSHKVEIRQKVRYDFGNVLKRKAYLGKISFSIICHIFKKSSLNAVFCVFFPGHLGKDTWKTKEIFMIATHNLRR